MNEEDFEAGRPQRSKISQGKLKSVQSMSRSTVAVDQNQQHSLRRTATAPPSYTNQPVYMDPNAVYGQPQPMVFQQPAYYPPPAPIYYPPAPPQPTVIIRQNQRVVPQRYNAYSDNNETFEGCFGPDVPHSQLFVNRSPICQQQEQLETFERNRPHQSSRARPEISVAEARALEEAIQLSLTESSRNASLPSHLSRPAHRYEEFESGATTMAANSDDTVVLGNPEDIADEKALQEAILLSLAEASPTSRSNNRPSPSAALPAVAVPSLEFNFVHPSEELSPPPTARQYPYNLTPELRRKSSFRTSFEQSTPRLNEQVVFADTSAEEFHEWRDGRVDCAREWGESNKRHQQQHYEQQEHRHHHQPHHHQGRRLSMEVLVPVSARRGEDRHHHSADSPPSYYRPAETARLYDYSQQTHNQFSPRARERGREGGREFSPSRGREFSPSRGREFSPTCRGRDHHQASYPHGRGDGGEYRSGAPHQRGERGERGGAYEYEFEAQFTSRSADTVPAATFAYYHHSDPRSTRYYPLQHEQLQQQGRGREREHRSASAPRSQPDGRFVAGYDLRNNLDPRMAAPTRRFRGSSSSPPRSRHRDHGQENVQYDIFVPPSIDHRAHPAPPAPLRKELSSSTVPYESRPLPPAPLRKELSNSSVLPHESRSKPAPNFDRRVDCALRRPDSTATMVERPAPPVPVPPQRGFSTATMRYDEGCSSGSEDDPEKSPQQQQKKDISPGIVVKKASSEPYKRIDSAATMMRPPPPYAPQRDYSSATVQYDAYASSSEHEEPYEDIRKQSSRRNTPWEGAEASDPARNAAAAGTTAMGPLSFQSPRLVAEVPMLEMEEGPLSTRRVYPEQHHKSHHHQHHHGQNKGHHPHPNAASYDDSVGGVQRARPVARGFYE